MALYYHYGPQIGAGFILESQVKGKDYDLEVELLNGIWVPCEVKTKLELTKLSKRTITKTLKAQKQTPKDEPCVIFLKLPQNWFEEDNCIEIVEDAIQEVLRNSERISMVLIHYEKVFDENSIEDLEKNTRYIEYHVGHIINENARYPIGNAYTLTKNSPQWRNLYDLVGYFHDPNRKSYFSYVDY